MSVNSLKLQSTEDMALDLLKSQLNSDVPFNSQELEKQIPLDYKLRLVYTGIYLADMADSYLTELFSQLNAAGIYRQKIKYIANSLSLAARKYRLETFGCYPLDVQEKFSDILEYLNDKYRPYLDILKYSVYRFLGKQINDNTLPGQINGESKSTLILRCLTTITLLQLMSAMAHLREKDFNESIQINGVKNHGIKVIKDDPNLTAMSSLSSKLILAMGSVISGINVNLNESEDIQTAFNNFTNRLSHIVEYVDEFRTQVSVG